MAVDPRYNAEGKFVPNIPPSLSIPGVSSFKEDLPIPREKLNEYLPVFIYSHARYAETEDCKVAYPSNNPDATYEDNFKSLNTIDDYFVEVPENTIVIDPIMPGALCNSGRALDFTFPHLISKYGLANWFSSGSLYRNPYKSIIRREEEEEPMDAITDFYNNTKLYLPGEKINNFQLNFDSHMVDNIPWVIRIPKLNDAGVPTGETQEILYHWTKNYSQSRGVDGGNCIYLSELLRKLKDTFRALSGIRYRKLALIFVSCRVYPTPYDIAKHIKSDILDEITETAELGKEEESYEETEKIIRYTDGDLRLRYYYIRENGMSNTNKYRPVTNMVLRRKAGDKVIRDEDEGAFDMSSPEISIFEEYTQSIIRETNEEILRRYNLWSKGEVWSEVSKSTKRRRTRGGSRKHKRHTKKRKPIRKKDKHKQTHKRRTSTRKKHKRQTKKTHK